MDIKSLRKCRRGNAAGKGQEDRGFINFDIPSKRAWSSYSHSVLIRPQANWSPAGA